METAGDCAMWREGRVWCGEAGIPMDGLGMKCELRWDIQGQHSRCSGQSPPCSSLKVLLAGSQREREWRHAPLLRKYRMGKGRNCQNCSLRRTFASNLLVLGSADTPNLDLLAQSFLVCNSEHTHVLLKNLGRASTIVCQASPRPKSEPLSHAAACASQSSPPKRHKTCARVRVANLNALAQCGEGSEDSTPDPSPGPSMKVPQCCNSNVHGGVRRVLFFGYWPTLPPSIPSKCLATKRDALSSTTLGNMANIPKT